MTALHAAGGGLPLALHIPHVVEQAGSFAGFASVLGLAILSALYFSQARDLRRLREWAGRAPERAAEGQPAASAPARVVAVPQQRPAAPVAGAAPAPAAVAAPATAAAAAPASGEAATQDEGEHVKPGEAAAAATNGDAAPSVKGPAAVEEAKDAGDEAKDAGDEHKDEEQAAAKPGMPAPASAAAAAAGAGAKSVTAPAAAAGAPAAASPAAAGSAAPSTSTGSTAPAAAPAVAGAAARPPAAPQRPPGSVLPPRTGTLPPVRRLPSSNTGPTAAQTGNLGPAPQKKKRNPLYVVLAVAGVLVLGAAAAVGVPALVNGSKDDNSKSSSSPKTTTTASTKTAAAAVAPNRITVAVLNGTSIPGLAAQVGDRVDAEGFKLGTVSNASQTAGQRANSVALYAPGHQSDASRVAKKLGIRNIQRIDANTQSIAGDAGVVVVVGSDKTQ